jgi:hypothetical protein
MSRVNIVISPSLSWALYEDQSGKTNDLSTTSTDINNQQLSTVNNC